MKMPSRSLCSISRSSTLVTGMVLTLLVFAFSPALLADDAVTVTVLEGTPGKTMLHYDIGAFSSKPVLIDGEEFLSIDLAGESMLREKGQPALPRICRSVVIPNASRVGVRVISANYYDLEGVNIAPSKGVILRSQNPEEVAYTFGPVYEEDQWFPSQAVTHSDPYILRDVRGTVVMVQPYQYNPVSKVLRVYTGVTVAVDRLPGVASVNVLPQSYSKPCKAFQQLQQRHFLNFNSGRYSPLDESGEMLIITYDSFNSNIQPLATWKNSQGINTTVVNVSSIGNNSSSIKTYISNFYNSHNLSFVLLVGDGPQVTSPMVSGSAADPAYSQIVGSDHYPEVMIGRFSASTAAQVDTQVQRTIEYEQLSHTEPWFWKGTGVASNQGPGHYGEYDDDHMDKIRNDLLANGYTEVDRIYDPYGTASQVSTAINSGRGIVNYCGHGSTTSWGTTGFSTSNVNNLTNDNKLPFITSVACLNGNFYSSTCFAEAWLRATHNGEPTGAIGMYASTISQSWNPPMDAQDEIIDRYVDKSYNCYGTLCFAGGCLMMDRNAGYYGYNEFDHWTVFGDPSLAVNGSGGGGVSVDIKINGSDGPLALPSSTQINLTVSVTPGNMAGTAMDWWIYVEKNWSTVYWWTPPNHWTPSVSPIRSYNGTLSDVNDYLIVSAKVPVGWWVFSFCIDDLNGVLEGTYSDTVELQTY